MGLYGREKSGCGTYVTTSLFANGIWNNGNGLIFGQFRKDLQNRDLERPMSPLANVYKCKDGRWISIFVSNFSSGFPRFFNAVGLDELLNDSRYESHKAMQCSGMLEECTARCREVFLQRSAQEWKEILISNDIACEVAQNMIDICNDEQALENDYVQKVRFANGMETFLANPPLQFSKYGRKEFFPCGEIGQDTDRILSDIGYSAEEIEQMREMNVVSLR